MNVELVANKLIAGPCGRQLRSVEDAKRGA